MSTSSALPLLVMDASAAPDPGRHGDADVAHRGKSGSVPPLDIQNAARELSEPRQIRLDVAKVGQPRSPGAPSPKI